MILLSFKISTLRGHSEATSPFPGNFRLFSEKKSDVAGGDESCLIVSVFRRRVGGHQKATSFPNGPLLRITKTISVDNVPLFLNLK